MTSDNPRIALLAFRLESNGHAPVVGRSEFRFLIGQEILDDLALPAPRGPAEFSGFVHQMNTLRRWTPVPIAVAAGGAAGPVEQGFFDQFLDDVRERLQAAMPLDGVFFAEHGAATATVDPDPDGTLFTAVREIVGPQAALIATLDLHANVSQKMVDAVDMLCSYLTNPHVDPHERGVESAAAMREMLDGLKTTKGFVKLPLIPPSIAQNTKQGPYGDIIRYSQTLLDDDVLNISICSGFSLGDTVKNGMSVTVTTRGDQARAEQIASHIAGRIWDQRERYLVKMTSLQDATQMMLERNRNPGLPALLFADPADNPGGGGRGNTTYILHAFLQAGVEDVVLAPFFDAPLAAEAHQRGVGARFDALFNSAEPSEFSASLSGSVEVIALHDGNIVGRRGVIAGRGLAMGKTALLRCDGVQVLVASRRIQFCDPAVVECVGVDISKLRGLVVKSRGHFRAAIDEFFPDDRIIEVDAPGLTTPALERVPYRSVPRPIYPLDRDVQWQSPTI